MKNKKRTVQRLEMIPNKRTFGLIVLMLMVITAFHYFTKSQNWQLHDFFRRLYYFPIILAAFKFRLRGALVVSVLTVSLYAPHLLVYFGEINMELLNQFLEAVMFIVLGLITGYLVEEDYQARKDLEDQIVKVSNLEKYTKNLLNSIDSGVIAFEKDGNLQSMNLEARKIFRSPENIHRFMRNYDIKDLLDRVIESGKSTSRQEITYINEKQQYLFLNLTLFPVKDVTEEIEGAVLMVQDITVLKELEEQVRRGERLAAIGELSAGVAHEIRNPLGIIKTISQSLKEENRDEEMEESLEIVEQEIHRANRVVQGLLDFAKPGKIKKERISLNTLLQDLALMTRKLAEQQGIQLIVEPGKADFIIEGDQDKLKQGLLNLVLNSIQAMNKKGEIRIRLTENSEETVQEIKWVQIIIEDQGSGIDAKNLTQIYDPFFTTKDQGTGLGLSITHRVIQEHKGRLEIISEVEKGTRVMIELPYISKEVEENA